MKSTRGDMTFNGREKKKNKDGEITRERWAKREVCDREREREMAERRRESKKTNKQTNDWNKKE